MVEQLRRRGNLLNAKNRNCCAWSKEDVILPHDSLKDWDYCGLHIDDATRAKGKIKPNQARKACCGGLEGWDPKNRWE